MNYTLLVASLLIAGTFGSAMVLLFRKLLQPQRSLPTSTDWIQDLSASRYRPMARLLSNDDFRFLASQPGYNRAMARRLRRERRKAFRGYLRCLTRDFGRVCTAIQLLLMDSAADRPDLAAALVKQRAIFRLNLLAVECRLLLHACGWNRMVDVRDLVGTLDVLGGELRRLVLVPQTAGSLA
ncbi:MAG TPA: hypothetical protein VG672_12415 [Bryobacteraceae bacterium]|jgi:hypothetical protein|nr:hypothetical protein [Bryobacteraceae bacterium]